MQEAKKSECENHIKWSPNTSISKMVRRFQIWTQNSNRITFDPFFLQNKLSRIGKMHDIQWQGQGQNCQNT